MRVLAHAPVAPAAHRLQLVQISSCETQRRGGPRCVVSKLKSARGIETALTGLLDHLAVDLAFEIAFDPAWSDLECPPHARQHEARNYADRADRSHAVDVAPETCHQQHDARHKQKERR